MALLPLPDVDLLGQVLRYDPETGRLFWLHRPRHFFTLDREFARWNNRYAGQEALTFITKQGYRRGIVLGRHILAHVVVFAMVHGHYADGDVDHINGDRADNRPDNLRDVSRLLNCRNYRRYQSNTSGRTGVHLRNGRWRARIGAAGSTRLGIFDTFEEAVAAREAAERQLDYHPNHDRVA